MYSLNGVFDDVHVRPWGGWGVGFCTNPASARKFTSWDAAYATGKLLEEQLDVRVAVKKA